MVAVFLPVLPVGVVVWLSSASEPEKKTISMGHKISSFYAPSSQVFLQDFIVIPMSF
jgi:hypothetical protein